MYDLGNKTVLITGGAGLIGRAFSKACATAGARVVVADIDDRKGRDLVEALKKETGNKDILFQRCDITDSKGVAAMVDSVAGKFGTLDALVNNAYPRNKNYGKRFEDVTFEDFCANVDMHLGGYFLMAREASRVMMKQKQGNIVNMGSIYGFSAPRFDVYKGTDMTMPVEYAAIKGGIINLTRYLASYLGPYNIRVNAISPGGVFDSQPEGFVKRYTQKVLLGGRMANQDDVTGTLMFLLSDSSKYLTGQNIVVDGGWSL